MRRVVPLTFVILVSGASIAAAEPQLGDDLATCRDRQAEAQARATACDNLLNADRLTGKDKALALVVRGNALITKRDYRFRLQQSRYHSAAQRRAAKCARRFQPVDQIHAQISARLDQSCPRAHPDEGFRWRDC